MKLETAYGGLFRVGIISVQDEGDSNVIPAPVKDGNWIYVPILTRDRSKWRVFAQTAAIVVLWTLR